MDRFLPQLRILMIFLLGLLFSLQACASVPARGTLTATQSCEAYVSKNKRTNPDQSKLEVGAAYRVFEANKAVSPSWYRITLQQANPPERWVAKHCGSGEIQIGGSVPPPGEADKCHTAGLADSYVLALSWQPAFCETHRDKPECHIDDRRAYQARNFTLHGLWPNKRECGTKYNYCGELSGRPGGFCDYPRLELFTEVRNELEVVMPSAAAGSCLQRHEWFKHGTCQTQWSTDAYFEISVELARQFNESGVAYYISRNIGKEVEASAFYARVDCALGSEAHKRLQLKCKNGNLVDIYINLPQTFDKNESLGEVVQRANPNFRSNCGETFRIDPIGYAN